MRARNLPPGLFSDEKLAACSPLARVLGLSLACQADRDGRLEDRPQRIKALGLPFDPADGNALLGELADAGVIVRYKGEGGRPLIQIADWSEYQRPHIDEKP